jgi:hypothetical protein
MLDPMSATISNDVLWERITRAVEAIRERLDRAAALDTAGIPYAVVGGNAVAVWVGLVDRGAVRTTRDIDVLLRRSDLAQATAALERAGFQRGEIFGVTTFLDGPSALSSESVQIVFAGELVQPDNPLPTPDVTESERPTTFQVATLDALVRMKLTSFRLKDQVHLQDLVHVGLIDASWCERLPNELSARLAQIISNPNA